MRCNEKLLEAYLNSELPKEQEKSLKEHIAACNTCGDYIAKSKSLNAVLQSYRHEMIEQSFLYSLNQIPHQTKKRFSLFNLFPRELAFAAVSVLAALYFGAFVSTMAISTNSDYFAQEQDIFEQISLASWIDR